jgi:hypothetical protein
MQPFDKDYLARREKQIQEMYMTRSMSWATLVTGLLVGLVSVPFLISGWTLGPILLVVSLLFLAGTIFMFASTFAQKSADQAIQKEHEELLALYGQSMEKPKRNSLENAARLADDGELTVEDSLEEQVRASTHREE